MKIERVIFLDIDGVLATDESQRIRKKFWFDDKTSPFDQRCVRVFNTILKLTDSEIVLTSSWRLFNDLAEIGKIFDFNRVLKKPVAITSELGDRDLEIETFIKENEIGSFLILDDLQINCFPDNFIRTQASTGLNKTHIEKAYKILMSDELID